MKNEAKINESFENLLMHYASQKKELEDKFQELVRAEQVILKQIIQDSGLDKGEYSLERREEGLFLISTRVEDNE